MEIIGLVENMSGLTCPHCGKMIEIYKAHGGMLTAKRQNLRLLASLPFEPNVVQGGDAGSMAVLDNDGLPFTKEFNRMMEDILKLHPPDRDIPSESEKRKVPIVEQSREDGKVIVVPVSDGRLSAHFGHCELFAFVKTENGKITGEETLTPPAHEPGVLPLWLHEHGADVVIAGGIGDRAQQVLKENGIEIITGAPTDSPESLVKQYLTGTLSTGENVCDH